MVVVAVVGLGVVVAPVVAAVAAAVFLMQPIAVYGFDVAVPCGHRC